MDPYDLNDDSYAVIAALGTYISVRIHNMDCQVVHTVMIPCASGSLLAAHKLL